MLSGTEAEIINCVARLKHATRGQIRRKVGFSLEYVGYVCRDLIRRGYLSFNKGYYFLDSDGIKTLLIEKTPKIDRKLLKEVAGVVTREITSELKKAVKQMELPARDIKGRAESLQQREIKIKTDFEFPVEDESLTLKTNIDKLGATSEREKSDIGDKIKLLAEIQKRRTK